MKKNAMEITPNMPADLKRRSKLNRDMQIYRRYCEGYTNKEISQHSGLNKSQICKILRELSKGGLKFVRLEATPWE